MMPSPLPFLFTALLILVPLGVLAWSRKAGLRAACLSASLVLLVFAWVFIPGAILRVEAERGDAVAMYEYARWIENHGAKLRKFFPLLGSPDVLAGYSWVEKSADRGYPPALYAKGVRLKYGEHVPVPTDWKGASGNVFPQPDRGQPYIDRATALGYQPVVPEEKFYWHVFREK